MERKRPKTRIFGPLLVLAGFSLWLLSLPVDAPRLGPDGSGTGLFGMAIAHAETADSSSSPPRPIPDDPTQPHP